MPSRETVTACIITLDEEERLPGALASVAFCDEIVVIDSGSHDRTQAIARAAGARVIENAWPGFARQRNVGIDHATGDWVLEVDADERVSPGLRAEIEAFLDPQGRSRDHDIAALPLRHRFLGGALGPSAKYPLYRHRMFRRGAYRHDEARTVHEGLWPRGPVWPFAGDLEHVLAASWGEALADWRAYVRLECEQSPSGSAAGVVVRPAAKVAWRTVVDGGWRDGWRGMAKIGLDAGVDGAVNLYGLRHRHTTDTGHYAAAAPRAGLPRIVGLASARDAIAADEWLRRADADAALITPQRGTAVRVRRIPRLGPLHVLRALDAEEQLRAVEALVPFGVLAARLVRALPGTPPVHDPVQASPAEVVARTLAGR